MGYPCAVLRGTPEKRCPSSWAQALSYLGGSGGGLRERRAGACELQRQAVCHVQGGGRRALGWEISVLEGGQASDYGRDEITQEEPCGPQR